MSHRPGPIAFTALCFGFVLASCTFQPKSPTPLAIQQDIQPAALAGPAGQEGKKLSAVGNESDCVLTTGDIHLWCKWITRYY